MSVHVCMYESSCWVRPVILIFSSSHIPLACPPAPAPGLLPTLLSWTVLSLPLLQHPPAPPLPPPPPTPSHPSTHPPDRSTSASTVCPCRTSVRCWTVPALRQWAGTLATHSCSKASGEVLDHSSIEAVGRDFGFGAVPHSRGVHTSPDSTDGQVAHGQAVAWQWQAVAWWLQAVAAGPPMFVF